jgi:transposase
MIPIPSGVRVWIATGHTDMRRGMQGLALQVQESLKRDHKRLYIFSGGRFGKDPLYDGSGCRSRNGWTAESSSGLRRQVMETISAAQMAYARRD